MLSRSFIWRSGAETYQATMRALLAAMPAALLLLPALARVGLASNDEKDYERAREALKAGEIRSLKDIVGNVENRCGGRVLDVELEEGSNGGRRFWRYELSLMMPAGDVLRLDINAATTEILGVKGSGIPDGCR
jgi:uncharacterized membrane protein YkoI